MEPLMIASCGWPSQGEAPPGVLFSNFKRLIEKGGITSADVAFYFVHWLTDLAGAEGAPLSGAEKFVLKFPHAVLNSFIRSFPIVQQLAFLTETELFERFLVQWWPVELGDVPTGSEAIALMRLVVQVQSPAARQTILEAFHLLPADDRQTLAVEMARTGIQGQAYSRSPTTGGPAFLVSIRLPHLRLCACARTLLLSAPRGLHLPRDTPPHTIHTCWRGKERYGRNEEKLAKLRASAVSAGRFGREVPGPFDSAVRFCRCTTHPPSCAGRSATRSQLCAYLPRSTERRAPSSRSTTSTPAAA